LFEELDKRIPALALEFIVLFNTVLSDEYSM